MEQKQTNITDLNFDVLKKIMSFIANSSNGAINFARITSISKTFKETTKDKEILKGIVFDDASVRTYDISFWHINGLLSKCANAGNLAARNLVLEDLKERANSLEAKMMAVASAKEKLDERTEAVRVVRTRARVRAAELARKELLEKASDLENYGYHTINYISKKLENQAC